jgi:hypothetical protein
MHTATAGGPAAGRTARLVALAAELAERSGHPHARARQGPRPDDRAARARLPRGVKPRLAVAGQAFPAAG